MTAPRIWQEADGWHVEVTRPDGLPLWYGPYRSLADVRAVLQRLRLVEPRWLSAGEAGPPEAAP